MKKLISLLSAIAVVMTASCSTASADNSVDLKQLASSLGADTDYINIPDKFYKNEYYDELEKQGLYNSPSYQPIVSTDVSDMLASKMSGYYSDSSLGTSILEILSHNGAIAPADLKAGAGSLSEITEYDDIKESIEYYSTERKNRAFYLSHGYLLNRKSNGERVDMLLDMAEKCMKENKYFLIMYSCYMNGMGDLNVSKDDSGYSIDYEKTESTHIQQTHSSAGIGITDGNWEFEGKIYDKCVLTVDNLAERGFSEDTCLYINSRTKEFYVPAFAKSAQGELHVISFDDTDMLNFNGLINPTENYPINDIDYITASFMSDARRVTRNVTSVDKDGKETAYKNKENDNYYDSSKDHFFLKGDKVEVDFINDNDSGVYFGLDDKDKFVDISMTKQDGTVNMDGGAFKLTRKVTDDNVYHKPTDPLCFSMGIRYYDYEDAPADRRMWDFGGDIAEDITLTPAENGFYAESEGNISLRWNMRDYSGTRTELNTYPEFDVIKPKSAGGTVSLSGNKVFISLKDDKPCVFFDSDGDGVFDDEFSRGDANCDGKIDAADASFVMEYYAKMAVVPKTTEEYEKDEYVISPYYDYNDDGIIDSTDASGILAEYAKSST